MTSEVCLMNRLAAVLAADSATTVTRWVEGHREERYFKGANKIFQLSNYNPLGLMIFDSADILGVPWELVAKEFRSTLGSRSFNSVAGYAQEFFSFLDDNLKLFPESVQKENFLTATEMAMLKFMIERERAESSSQALLPVDEDIDNKILELENIKFHNCTGKEIFESIISSMSSEIEEKIITIKEMFEGGFPSDMNRAILFCVLSVLKNPKMFLDKTGLVFCGYGEHEIFPSIIEYTSCGIIMNRHVSDEISRNSINHDTHAHLGAFAQTSMADTFQAGIGQDVYLSIMSELDSGLEKFAEELLTANGLSLDAAIRVTEMKESSRRAIGRAVLDRAREDHIKPLRAVLSVLPIDEMAGLAETLISLQSLKEKVTKPSETVGGPVDVAVITRNEGFVWIKRKHFFDPSLNSRYMQRQAALLTR